MAGGSNIAAIDLGETFAEADGFADVGGPVAGAAGIAWVEPDPGDLQHGPAGALGEKPASAPGESRHADRIAPTLGGAAVIGWTAFFVWAHRPDFAPGGDPRIWSALVSEWAIPVLLILVVWLLVMRRSRSEASRFRDVAQALAAESERLEARLVSVNRELGAAQRALSAGSRELEGFGERATERLAGCAQRLQELVAANGERIEAIGGNSETALANMDRLREQLPLIANSTRDVTGYIGHAGRSAQEQVLELHGALQRLGDAGTASEQQVRTLRATVDTAIAEFAARCDQLGTVADERFALLAENGAEFRTQLDAQEAEALTAIRNRAGALTEEIEQLRGRLEADESARIEALRSGFAALRESDEALGGSIEQGKAHALETWREAIARVESDLGSAFTLIENADRDMTDASNKRLLLLAEQAEQFDARLDRGLSAHLGRFDTLRTQLDEVDQTTTAIEARVAGARSSAERESDHGFARLAAEITETLNRAAVDIERALSQDVPDTKWSAYLGGDRSVFTRRAARLLGRGETQSVGALYRDDAAFRGLVERYLADFETLLQRALASAEGNALGVTLLSSDMGKLYVALAQATKRLAAPVT